MKRITEVLNRQDQHWVGNGFKVSSIFHYQTHGRELSPFLLLDYAAPLQFPGDGKRRGVDGHPHKGFETVTIAYQGEVSHRDSTGGGGTIGAGDVQWMTAGSGLLHEELHSEAFSRDGGIFEMVQLWVNLPAKHKGETPRYQTLDKANIPVVEVPGADANLWVISGEYNGTPGAAETFTPIDLWDVTAASSTSFTLPAKAGQGGGVLVLQGDARIGDRDVTARDLVIFDRDGSDIAIESKGPARFLFLSGEPIDEPIAGYGPFVMNTQEEIAAAFEQFRSGEMGEQAAAH